jgi:hypothetical protein
MLTVLNPASTRRADPHMHTVVQAGELTAVIGDNEAYEGHRAGYNGVHSLSSVHCQDSLFVPGIAGLNLEHLLDGRDIADPDEYFEPRRHPMDLEQIDEYTVQLHQMATPTMKVQSLTTFALREPYYLDTEFRVVLREDVLAHDYLLCFWASYLNQPADNAIYLLGRRRDERAGEGWLRFSSPAHNDHSTVCSTGAEPELPRQLVSRDSLAFNYSELAFTRPFYYGLRGEMVYAIMFDRTESVRFTHSPTGGGQGNPAWDFQLVINHCAVDREYVMRARVVYTRWVDQDDILREYERWDPLLAE